MLTKAIKATIIYCKAKLPRRQKKTGIEFCAEK
jgi:hypothetical protein